MKLNNLFHISIYRCARSELLLETIEHLWLRIGPYLSYIASEELRQDTRPDRSFERHAEIIDGLEVHNIERAVAGVHADIDNGTHLLLKGVNVGINRQFNQLTLVESAPAPSRRATKLKNKGLIQKIKT
jgi:DNA-binding GntR family transcriptional regulator